MSLAPESRDGGQQWTLRDSPLPRSLSLPLPGSVHPPSGWAPGLATPHPRTLTLMFSPRSENGAVL